MEGKILLIVCIVMATVKINSGFKNMEELAGAMQHIRKECSAKFMVTDEQIHGFNSGNFPEDKTIKCYVNCAMEMMKIMKDGKFLPESAKEQIATLPEELRESSTIAMNACQGVCKDIADPCEASYAATKCYQKNNPKFAFP